MKPIINDKKCGASKNACKAINVCPAQAIRYTEVDKPVADRNVVCDSGCGCGCGCGESVSGCSGSPYGRIVIDYGKCIECGVCAEECCGNAIDMIA